MPEVPKQERQNNSKDKDYFSKDKTKTIYIQKESSRYNGSLI